MRLWILQKKKYDATSLFPQTHTGKKTIHSRCYILSGRSCQPLESVIFYQFSFIASQYDRRSSYLIIHGVVYSSVYPSWFCLTAYTYVRSAVQYTPGCILYQLLLYFSPGYIRRCIFILRPAPVWMCIPKSRPFKVFSYIDRKYLGQFGNNITNSEPKDRVWHTTRLPGLLQQRPPSPLAPRPLVTPGVQWFTRFK